MMTFIRRIDWRLLIPIVLIMGASLLMLSSSSSVLFDKQLKFIILGLVLLVLAPLVDLRPIISNRWFIFVFYILNILSLAIVHIVGTEINGSKSWIDLGSFNLQPSEFAKAALIATLAAFFSRRHVGIKRLEIIFGSFTYFIIPAIMVLTEPDMGSTLIFFGIWFGFLLVAGLPSKYIMASLMLFAVFGGLAWQYGLKNYQKARIVAVFQPEKDPLRLNYNIIQSKNAIGSAGLLGKGFKQGEIVQLGFLPAAQTDFAMASFIEEWGFLGGLLVISLFVLLIVRIAVIGLRVEGNFNKLFALGTIIFLALHFVVNLGSAIGFMPVIGVPFPFLSYGGSNLLTASFLIAIVHSIAAKTVT